jgi:hypothetical protein
VLVLFLLNHVFLGNNKKKRRERESVKASWPQLKRGEEAAGCGVGWGVVVGEASPSPSSPSYDGPG